MLLVTIFLNHNHRLHNRHVHNYNYLLHKNYRTTTWTSMISVFIQQHWNTRRIWHLYFIQTTIIQKWFFFLCPTNLFWQTKPSVIPFRSPSQQPQTQTSNRNEHPIIRFHEENMDDFSGDEDQQFFDHINHQSDDQSDDQSNDEGVGGPTTPLSPPLQYHQSRCPVDLNLDHLPHYIDRHHFIQQQHNVQPPTSAPEVGMIFDEKTQCIRGVKEYNIRNYFDCKTIFSDQRSLNFVCKSHENGCTWSLSASSSKRHKKWIIKSIRGHYTCLVHTQTRWSVTWQTRHSTDHPTNCQNKPNHLHQDIDCINQNVHELYPILQKDMVSKAKSVSDDS